MNERDRLIQDLEAVHREVSAWPPGERNVRIPHHLHRRRKLERGGFDRERHSIFRGAKLTLWFRSKI